MKKFRAFNDGVALVGDIKSDSTFRGPSNPTKIDDFDIKFSICFDEMSKREQDVEMIHALNNELNLKIKTPMCNLIKPTSCLIINNFYYQIVHMDSSKQTDELYLYLQEVRELE